MQTLNLNGTTVGELQFADWGLIDYKTALAQQEQLVEQVAGTRATGTIVFCSHPPVVTLGRKTQPGDVFGWRGAIQEISRGGRATYHGPSQLVIYPIFNLDSVRNKRDLHWYLRSFENAIVETMQRYGIQANGRSLQTLESANSQEETGVWVGNRKLASIGIAVRKWVTYHGAAINVDHDPEAFQGMKPCGFNSTTMISMEKILDQKVNRQDLIRSLEKSLSRHLLDR